MRTRIERLAVPIGLATGALIGLVAGVGLGMLVLLAQVAPDIIPSIKHERADSVLYEDGSYRLGLGEYTVSGCAPVHPWNGELVTGWCMDGGTSALGYFKRGAWVWAVGIDSPWEDFAPRPISDLIYIAVGFFK